MILAGIVAGPLSPAHAEFSCNLTPEHQANPDHFECHFVHVEVHGAPIWKADIDFYRDTAMNDGIDSWSTGDYDNKGSRTLTWDCAREPVQPGEWPCTGTYRAHVRSVKGRWEGEDSVAPPLQPLNTNHCFVVRPNGAIGDAGTSWESCNTN